MLQPYFHEKQYEHRQLEMEQRNRHLQFRVKRKFGPSLPRFILSLFLMR